MIHKAIFEESKTGIPKFEKAFVMIEITTPRGSNNPKVWDTSNRAINVIINNLKGIFFRDDFEHMACGIVADWGENGRTTIRICELEDLLGVWFSVRKSKIYDLSQNLIEYKLRRSSIGCKIYRNMLICSNMQVQKNHKNRGVL